MTVPQSASAATDTRVGASPLGIAGGTPGAAGPGSASLWSDAWHDLRVRPLFLLASVLLLVLIAMAAAPGFFTSKDPTYCTLSASLLPPRAEAIFGNDLQGCDVYARTVYGARASMLVGVLAAVFAFLLGSTLGVVAGYAGGWFDALISRTVDVFFGIPLLLGALLVLYSIPATGGFAVSVTKVALVLAILGWTVMARVMRAAAIQVRQSAYVEAARALGATAPRILLRHVLPNALAPGLVVATISLGGFIGAEATLSYLGLGLEPSVISWGAAISDSQARVRVGPHALYFPAAFLSATVLAFIMLGDALRDALDPRLR